MFHGLEGSTKSHYAQAFAIDAAEQGTAFALPHFCGCSGEVNRLPRAYHSGDSAEIDWILRRFHTQHPGQLICAAGVSLGGNALMKWLGEQGSAASTVLHTMSEVPMSITGDSARTPSRSA